MSDMRWEKADNDIRDQLLCSLKDIVSKFDDSDTAVAFSGGVDSTLLAAMTKLDTPLYTIGMKDSYDLIQAERTAALMGRRKWHRKLIINVRMIEEKIPHVAKMIDMVTPMNVNLALAQHFVADAASCDGIKVLISGQGADEIFGGYRRYVKVIHEHGSSAAMELIEKDTGEVNGIVQGRDIPVIKECGLTPVMPYLYDEIVSLSRSVPLSLKIGEVGERYVGKYLLRAAADGVLPSGTAWSDKKSIQYGTGIKRSMEKLAKAKGYTGYGFTGRYINSLVASTRSTSDRKC